MSHAAACVAVVLALLLGTARPALADELIVQRAAGAAAAQVRSDAGVRLVHSLPVTRPR